MNTDDRARSRLTLDACYTDGAYRYVVGRDARGLQHSFRRPERDAFPEWERRTKTGRGATYWRRLARSRSGDTLAILAADLCVIARRDGRYDTAASTE